MLPSRTFTIYWTPKMVKKNCYKLRESFDNLTVEIRWVETPVSGRMRSHKWFSAVDHRLRFGIDRTGTVSSMNAAKSFWSRSSAPPKAIRQVFELAQSHGGSRTV